MRDLVQQADLFEARHVDIAAAYKILLVVVVCQSLE